MRLERNPVKSNHLREEAPLVKEQVDTYAERVYEVNLLATVECQSEYR